MAIGARRTGQAVVMLVAFVFCFQATLPAHAQATGLAQAESAANGQRIEAISDLVDRNRRSAGGGQSVTVSIAFLRERGGSNDQGIRWSALIAKLMRAQSALAPAVEWRYLDDVATPPLLLDELASVDDLLQPLRKENVEFSSLYLNGQRGRIVFVTDITEVRSRLIINTLEVDILPEENRSEPLRDHRLRQKYEISLSKVDAGVRAILIRVAEAAIANELGIAEPEGDNQASGEETPLVLLACVEPSRAQRPSDVAGSTQDESLEDRDAAISWIMETVEEFLGGRPDITLASALYSSEDGRPCSKDAKTARGIDISGNPPDGLLLIEWIAPTADEDSEEDETPDEDGNELSVNITFNDTSGADSRVYQFPLVRKDDSKRSSRNEEQIVSEMRDAVLGLVSRFLTAWRSAPDFEPLEQPGQHAFSASVTADDEFFLEVDQLIKRSPTLGAWHVESSYWQAVEQSRGQAGNVAAKWLRKDKKVWSGVRVISAIHYYLSREFAKALRELRLADRVQPGWLEALVLRSEIYRAMGRVEDAVEELEAAPNSQASINFPESIALPLFQEDEYNIGLRLAQYILEQTDGTIEDRITLSMRQYDFLTKNVDERRYEAYYEFALLLQSDGNLTAAVNVLRRGSQRTKKPRGRTELRVSPRQ